MANRLPEKPARARTTDAFRHSAKHCKKLAKCRERGHQSRAHNGELIILPNRNLSEIRPFQPHVVTCLAERDNFARAAILAIFQSFFACRP
jgi:hypothetical protein